MKRSLIRPKWWQLILSITLVLGLFYKEATSPLSKAGHTVIEIGLVFLLYGLVMAWLNVNETALISDELEEYKKMTVWNRRGSPLSGSNHVVDRNDNNRAEPVETDHEGRTWPVWVNSVMAIVVALFKIQDQ
jgi:hypothetical protein